MRNCRLPCWILTADGAINAMRSAYVICIVDFQSNHLGWTAAILLYQSLVTEVTDSFWINGRRKRDFIG